MTTRTMQICDRCQKKRNIRPTIFSSDLKQAEKGGGWREFEGKHFCSECVQIFLAGITQPTQDYVEIGPECFSDAAGTIISYKGENYYRACDTFVGNVLGGGQSFCVKRVGHPGSVHEDFDGNKRED